MTRTQPPRPNARPAAVIVKLSMVFIAGLAIDQGQTTAGVLIGIVAALSWWRLRQAVRYLLAVAGMALIRGWVVRHARPYADELGDPGRVTDPDAPWRQWLDTRCPTCGT